MEVLFLVNEFSWNLQNNYAINFKGKTLIIARISSQKNTFQCWTTRCLLTQMLQS